MRSKLCFLMTWFFLWQIKLTFMHCNMVKVIWTFWRMKSSVLLQFYCCHGIAKFHIEIFTGKTYLTRTMKQSYVQWAEIDFERYYQTFIWLTTHRLQKKRTTEDECYLKSRISISNSMAHLYITSLMKTLSLATENMVQNNLLEESQYGLGLNLGA